jgi:transposase
VYDMSMFAKVRRLFHRDNLSISEIQRRTSLSRNTIKVWLKETRPDSYKYPERAKVDGKLTPFIPALLLALEADSRRPKRDRRTALMLFDGIKKDGYTGGYSILTDYVRNWRNGESPQANRLMCRSNSNLAKPSSLIGAMNG